MALTTFCVAIPTSTQADVLVSEKPLVGAVTSYGPNVVIDLSIEYPTAGFAYPTTTMGNLDEFKTTSPRFLGYFDNAKCYTYVQESGSNATGTRLGYFTPSGYAKNISGYWGCDGANDYSGNFMNWFTMSAMDIYRQTMTGGNRAKGLGATAAVYNAGDTTTSTFLRKGRYQSPNSSLKTLTFPASQVSTVLKSLLPDKFSSTTGSGSGASYVYLEKSGTNVKFYARHNISGVDQFQVGLGKNDGSATGTGSEVVTVVVEACRAGFLETNCKKYGSVYKPEGQMQENIITDLSQRQESPKFSLFSYLNIANNVQDGGVMRSPLKYLNNEVNQSTGQFPVNPDNLALNSSTSLTGTYYLQNSNGTLNSGVINYINKFGDASGYKTYDPAAELYYASLRYLRGKSNLSQYINGLSASSTDGFPAYLKWNDPYKTAYDDNDDVSKMICRSNMIMYLGDTNSHQDRGLPNFEVGSEGTSVAITDDDIPTADYLKKILVAEGKGANPSLYTSYGSQNSPAGISALAYWAHVNNIRGYAGDTVTSVKPITVNSFMIDVVENGRYKNAGNAFYWAAKYGGFDTTTGLTLPLARSQWTTDAVGATTIADFTDGVPDYYAAANNPNNMVSAIKAAFEKSKISGLAAQTAVGSGSTTMNIKVSNDGTQGDLMFQSLYDGQNWTGDLQAFRYIKQGTKWVKPASPNWSAANILDSNYHNASNYANRTQVFTTVGGVATAFNTANASGLTSALGLSTTAEATTLIQYILGNSANEGLSDSTRTRKSILGTLVNSPSLGITTDASGLECAANAPANPPIHVGVAANDGMYHIFNSSGQEVFSYLPSTSLAELKMYADKNYDHIYLNDGSSTLKTYCEGGATATPTSYVVGATGRGGKSVYAFDVTNLSTPNANTVLWEFTDADMGLTIGEPVLTQDQAGRPIALVTSGYNSGTANGYLYVLYLDKPRGQAWAVNSNYFKIALGNSGVAGAFAYDANRDGKVDRVYVGDLSGSVWRVDHATAGSWMTAFSGAPLINVGKNITAQVSVQMVSNQVMVFFGTGKYLTGTDLTGQSNSVYGVFDNNNAITTPKLLDQTLSQQVNPVDSSNPVTWSITKNPMPSGYDGWKIDLWPNQIVVDTVDYLPRSKSVTVRVIQPDTVSDPCTVSGASYDLTVKAYTGADLDQAIYDTNGDGVINSLDIKGGFFKAGDTIQPFAKIITLTNTSGVTDGCDTYSVDSTDPQCRKDPSEAMRFKRLSWREIF
ncbi:hypothetical protein LVJ82_07325 [Vitreoscilla massiliensis]|uniref:PilC beta-propeller domain-containing protein n=2 Tax=Vitreoscilla massiliensis TaxID=1689272 RepID=A0ABY4E5X8_9NEIS|nr:PilC/PilY family type IV pilus protein [Vitreoscilla massiliensis]UOO90770.1 hypothetical protein LVJ82_07325 [Vitreoscilla massiliensis]